MNSKDYKSILSEYRNDLLARSWFLEKQSNAWSAVENFVGHHFSNTLVFFLLFLLGAVFALTLVFGGKGFWGGIILFVGALSIYLSFFLVGRFKRTLATRFYMAYIQDRITSEAYLDEISRLEYELHQDFNGLVGRIHWDIKALNECSPDNIDKIKHIAEGLVYFSDMLIDTKKSFYDLNNIRKVYTDPKNCFDLEILNAVIEHHR